MTTLFNPSMEKLVAIAKRAGREILKVYETDFSVETKDDQSPVTIADRIAEDLITKAILSEISGTIPIVGEEAAADGHRPDLSGGEFWLIDPLDGTKQFISRNGQFTVNIALIRDARPVLGIVQAPALGSCYWGSAAGAFAEIDGAPARPIHVRKAPSGGMIAVASRSHRTPETNAYLERIGVRKTVSTGSSLKFCLVASGEADIYPRMGRTMEWDTAAGQAVLEAAGGRVANPDGSDFLYNKPGLENSDFIAFGDTDAAPI